MTLCFTASSAVHAWEYVHDLSAVMSSICSQLQLVNSVAHHGAVYRATCIDDTHVKYGSVSKCRQTFRCRFHDERVPSRQTIHSLMNKIRTTGLLIDK
jgi:hypothetical protein